jgi:hypothetical protein
VWQKNILKKQKSNRPMLNLIGKLGAGINIPRTDFTWKGDRLNNKFHIAGYNISAEGGARYYFGKRFLREVYLQNFPKKCYEYSWSSSMHKNVKKSS